MNKIRFTSLLIILILVSKVSISQTLEREVKQKLTDDLNLIEKKDEVRKYVYTNSTIYNCWGKDSRNNFQMSKGLIFYTPTSIKPDYLSPNLQEKSVIETTISVDYGNAKNIELTKLEIRKVNQDILNLQLEVSKGRLTEERYKSEIDKLFKRIHDIQLKYFRENQRVNLPDWELKIVGSSEFLRVFKFPIFKENGEYLVWEAVPTSNNGWVNMSYRSRGQSDYPPGIQNANIIGELNTNTNKLFIKNTLLESIEEYKCEKIK